jgi:hypothetical protein
MDLTHTTPSAALNSDFISNNNIIGSNAVSGGVNPPSSESDSLRYYYGSYPLLKRRMMTNSATSTSAASSGPPLWLTVFQSILAYLKSGVEMYRQTAAMALEHCNPACYDQLLEALHPYEAEAHSSKKAGAWLKSRKDRYRLRILISSMPLLAVLLFVVHVCGLLF